MNIKHQQTDIYIYEYLTECQWKERFHLHLSSREEKKEAMRKEMSFSSSRLSVQPGIRTDDLRMFCDQITWPRYFSIIVSVFWFLFFLVFFLLYAFFCFQIISFVIEDSLGEEELVDDVMEKNE